jgi:molybdopterin biosynthesis enzyme
MRQTTTRRGPGGRRGARVLSAPSAPCGSGDDPRTAGFKDRTGVETARERFLDSLSPLDRTNRVALTEADGRVLAEAVDAPRPVPHYERAAMDGYAVRAEDTFRADEAAPATLELGGVVHAGERPDAAVEPGTAVEISTGAVLPPNADVGVALRSSAAAPDLEYVPVGTQTVRVLADPGRAEKDGVRALDDVLADVEAVAEPLAGVRETRP